MSTRGVPRYDLVTNYRCGSSIEEMERNDENGEWVRYEDVETLAGRRAAPPEAKEADELARIVEEESARVGPAPQGLLGRLIAVWNRLPEHERQSDLLSLIDEAAATTNAPAD